MAFFKNFKNRRPIRIISCGQQLIIIILILNLILKINIVKCHTNNILEIFETNLEQAKYSGDIKKTIIQDTHGIKTRIEQNTNLNKSISAMMIVTTSEPIIETTGVITEITKNMTIFRNYSALSNFKGEVDPEFLALINSFWLKFPPTTAKAHYTLGIIYTFMMIFGVSGNALVIYMFIRCKTLRTPANTLVINLAVSDFIMMAKAPLFIYNSFNEGPATGILGCRLYGFIGGLTGTVSITTLTAISIDRYNVVVYPLNPLRSTTRWRSRLMVLFVWLYSLFFSGIPLLNLGLSKYVPEGYLTACSFDYLSIDRDERIFMFCYFIFAWVAPFTAISYCYIHILRVVIGANSIQSSKDKNKTEIKLAAIVFCVIGLWFLAWTPYAIVCLLGISGNQDKLTPLGSMLPAIFCKMAALIDPYVYAVTHPRFRLEFGKMFLGRQDTRLQFQTSYNSRGTSRRVRDNPQETIPISVIKRPPLERGASSFSELSLSIDLTDNVMPTLVEDSTKI